MEEKDDSLLLAVAQLEDIVAETSATAAADVVADDLAQPSEPRRILYCGERLRPLSDEPRGKRPVRALRARLDIGQAACPSLSRIYRDMGVWMRPRPRPAPASNWPPRAPRPTTTSSPACRG